MQGIFSVFDLKSGLYGRPFVAAATGVAIRQFTDEVNRSEAENLLYHHPADFDLYHVGNFDETTGLVNPVSATDDAKPICILRAIDVKRVVDLPDISNFPEGSSDARRMAAVRR